MTAAGAGISLVPASLREIRQEGVEPRPEGALGQSAAHHQRLDQGA